MLDISLKKVLRTTSKHLENLKNLNLQTIQDFLLYFPRNYTDASKITPLNSIQMNELGTFEGKLSNFFSRKTKTGKFLTRAIFTDETGSIEVIWFNQPHVTQLLPAGKAILLTGKPKRTIRRITLINPTGEIKNENPVHTARIVPLYHETKGITSKWLRSKIKPILEAYKKELEEYLPEKIKKENNLINYADAVCEAHFPSSEELLEKAKKRLAFDELFLLQLKALQKKWKARNEVEHFKKIKIELKEIEKFLESLPFTLTNSQKKVLSEIITDLEKPYPMSRLLQGDVGSGKTVIAAAACFTIIKAGFQTAIMAPTEILAKQHFRTISKLLSPHGINIQILAGSTNEKAKKEIYKGIETGTLDCIIGTHALIEEKIRFKKLGLAVIDEQHRFGVKQREILKNNGTPHLLNLSATPIPRTLAMTIYGDQDLSIIDELPPGRISVVTRIVPEEKRMDAYNWMKKKVQEGRQVFIICPLIDEIRDTTEQNALNDIQLKAVIQEYEYLKSNIFPNLKLSFLHGKLKQEEKDKIMEKFSRNEINILVSTSVIEVGIDVPNASIMVIEGAERFGLAQLHQFRGRVGRGVHQSYCFLFTNKENPQSTKRLMAMVQYESGFKLAEIDLQIRGPGEIYGAKQSGIPDLKMASFSDSETILLARIAAQKIIDQDPGLKEFPKLKEKIESAKEVFVKD